MGHRKLLALSIAPFIGNTVAASGGQYKNILFNNVEYSNTYILNDYLLLSLSKLKKNVVMVQLKDLSL